MVQILNATDLLEYLSSVGLTIKSFGSDSVCKPQPEVKAKANTDQAKLVLINEVYADLAEAALKEYVARIEITSYRETTFLALLTDLRHLADRYGISFKELNGIARKDYLAQIKESPMVAHQPEYVEDYSCECNVGSSSNESSKAWGTTFMFNERAMSDVKPQYTFDEASGKFFHAPGSYYFHLGAST